MQILFRLTSVALLLSSSAALSSQEMPMQTLKPDVFGHINDRAANFLNENENDHISRLANKPLSSDDLESMANLGKGTRIFGPVERDLKLKKSFILTPQTHEYELTLSPLGYGKTLREMPQDDVSGEFVLKHRVENQPNFKKDASGIEPKHQKVRKKFILDPATFQALKRGDIYLTGQDQRTGTNRLIFSHDGKLMCIDPAGLRRAKKADLRNLAHGRIYDLRYLTRIANAQAMNDGDDVFSFDLYRDPKTQVSHLALPYDTRIKVAADRRYETYIKGLNTDVNVTINGIKQHIKRNQFYKLDRRHYAHIDCPGHADYRTGGPARLLMIKRMTDKN